MKIYKNYHSIDSDVKLNPEDYGNCDTTLYLATVLTRIYGYYHIEGMLPQIKPIDDLAEAMPVIKNLHEAFEKLRNKEITADDILSDCHDDIMQLPDWEKIKSEHIEKAIEVAEKLRPDYFGGETDELLEIRMKYSKYKDSFSKFLTVEDSYNSDDKTIVVLVPKSKLEKIEKAEKEKE